MKITILCVGKLKEKYLKEGIVEYQKRLSRYTKLQIIEVPDEKAPETLSPKQIKQIKDKEGQKILSKLPQSYVISLDLSGKQYTSESFAQTLSTLTTQGNSHITFIIGGSLGLSKEVLNNSHLKLSFGSFTYPHQLMRLILLEQIYRTFRINNNEPYHK
jgi:23S rRNA (pseudouridine1915-N3)-methyltransferase